MIITYARGPIGALPRFVKFGMVFAGVGFGAMTLLGLL
jgi:hypothetical protein